MFRYYQFMPLRYLLNNQHEYFNDRIREFDYSIVNKIPLSLHSSGMTWLVVLKGGCHVRAAKPPAHDTLIYLISK